MILMKNTIISILEKSLNTLGYVDIPADSIKVERTRSREHGDFSCNIAMVLAKRLGENPREFAQKLIDHCDLPNTVIKVEVAGPGFINFFIADNAQQQVVETILSQGREFGRAKPAQADKVHIEFVSANPTGPLHVGHGRGAAFGSALANVLEAAGFNVHREYYVNDAGRQMDILAVSVWLRYLALCGEKFVFPLNGYQGDYVVDIAKTLLEQEGKRYYWSAERVFADVPADEGDLGGDKEKHIDRLINNAKHLLDQDYTLVHQAGLQTVLSDIRDDLAEFRVEYQEWFSEKSLAESDATKAALQELEANDFLYEKEGATWFRSTDFGDEKDRVIVRDNGQTTYLASDAAYLRNKFARGYDRAIYVLGADHHGYVPRLKALMQAFKLDLEKLHIPLVQFAVLYRGTEQVKMSTRKGEFVTLRQLREEVGTDAARFFYVMRKPEQHLDFDLELAKSQSNDNPVYYVQYAHARICSVFRQLKERNLSFNQQQGLALLSQLQSEHEVAILTQLSKYPELIQTAAARYEPHQLTYYLRELANAFHSYYNVQQFLVDDEIQRHVRLVLLKAIQQVLANGLEILGISTPESM